MSIGCKFCTLWVFLSWLLCACNDPAPVASDGEKSTTTQQAADERGSAQHKATPLRESRAAELKRTIERTRAEHAALVLQRDNLIARLEAQQSQGRELLAQIRSEMSALRGQPSADSSTSVTMRAENAAKAFEGESRARLEGALAADERVRVELDGVNLRLADVESRLSALDNELATEQAKATNSQ